MKFLVVSICLLSDLENRYKYTVYINADIYVFRARNGEQITTFHQTLLQCKCTSHEAGFFLNFVDPICVAQRSVYRLMVMVTVKMHKCQQYIRTTPHWSINVKPLSLEFGYCVDFCFFLYQSSTKLHRYTKFVSQCLKV